MKKMLAAALTSICLLAPAAAALADEEKCPVTHQGEAYLNDVRKAIEASPNCTRADAIATACALRASGDNAIVEPAITRCEAAFKDKLTKRQRRTYAARRKRCVKKYARKQGTMYISMSAFCELGVATKFAARYGTSRSATAQ